MKCPFIGGEGGEESFWGTRFLSAHPVGCRGLQLAGPGRVTFGQPKNRPLAVTQRFNTADKRNGAAGPFGLFFGPATRL